MLIRVRNLKQISFVASLNTRAMKLLELVLTVIICFLVYWCYVAVCYIKLLDIQKHLY